MEFNDLLQIHGFNPRTVALALHKPSSLPARHALRTMAEEDGPAFCAYQATHPPIQEATVKSRPFLASFVVSGEGEMCFAGMFKNHGAVPVAPGDLEKDEDFLRMSEAVELRPRSEIIALLDRFTGRLRFDLRLMKNMAELRGRLVLPDPVARNYMRLPERTPLPVLEIARVPQLAPPMPPWDQLVVTTREMRSLPRDWRLRLAAWRGIYLIVDQSDGARCVGAAYGAENLLGRWLEHVSGKLGVTKELSRRDTGYFRFSVLELLSPTADSDEVIAQERKWMTRLDTIENGLNT